MSLKVKDYRRRRSGQRRLFLLSFFRALFHCFAHREKEEKEIIKRSFEMTSLTTLLLSPHYYAWRTWRRRIIICLSSSLIKSKWCMTKKRKKRIGFDTMKYTEHLHRSMAFLFLFGWKLFLVCVQFLLLGLCDQWSAIKRIFGRKKGLLQQP